MSKLTLYEIEDELVRAAEAPEGPSTELVKGYLEAAMEKRDRMAGFLRGMKRAEQAIEDEVLRLIERKEQIASARGRMEAHVIHVMQALGLGKLKGNLSTISVRQNPPHVEIADVGLLPQEFRVAVPASERPDKHKIKSELVEGREVLGAALVEGQFRLDIR